MVGALALAWLGLLLGPGAAPGPAGTSAVAAAGAPGGAAVTFCGQTLAPETTTLTCYEGRGREEALDLAPLARLPELRELRLVSGEIEFVQTLRVADLAPLARLPRLRTLELGEVRFPDATPLGRLVGLEALTLHACPLRDAGVLAALTQLVSLELSSVAVEDVRPLAALA